MKPYSLSHLADHVLLRELSALVSKDCSLTAELLAHIAEVDERRLYLPKAFSSMFAYCVGELHMSEDAAYKRIQAARAARQFPAILEAVADGRLHLSAIVQLAPHLTPETARELLTAAEHKSKSEIELLLARRFPRADLPTVVRALPSDQAAARLLAPDAAAAASIPEPVRAARDTTQLVPEPVPSTVPELASLREPVKARSSVNPISPERFALQLTMSQELHDKLRRAQALLSHAVPSGDIPQVLERALDELIAKLEQRRFAATARPRAGRRSARERHIPAAVKRIIWQRDNGRCTFVSSTGRRCGETRLLEYDHVNPVARGGQPTVEGLRLRCRAHNQYAADCAFGAGFMREKREGRAGAG